VLGDPPTPQLRSEETSPLAQAAAASAPSRPLGFDLASVTVCSVIWGTTWFVITFQLGQVPAAWSIAYRFGLAALALAGWCIVTRRSLRLTPAQHLTAFGQGLFTFALDYSFVYAAETKVLSGVVAVVFASLALCNLIMFRLVLGRRASWLAWGGAALGVAGVAVLSYGELAKADMNPQTLAGIGLALLGVLTGTIGNIFAFRQEALRASVGPATAWAMGYGALALAVWALVTGQPIAFDTGLPYVASLAYLALFGSVVAFIVYYALARRRSYTFASYIAALTPPTAMLVSAVFEKAHWGLLAIVGLVLVLSGQVLLIKAPRT
jgi:drug/metabolite transporter (DMT)-like permease